jgi:hypothetical protein
MATRTRALAEGQEDRRPPPDVRNQGEADPGLWQLTARRLVRAANVLYEGHPEAQVHQPTYASLVPVLVLYGLATENLVKALLAAQGWRGECDPRLKSHHLAWLFEQAKVSLSAKDAEILDRLQWFLDQGRNSDDVQPGHELGGEVARLLRLLTRLEDALAVAVPDKVLPGLSLFELGLDGPTRRPGGDLAPEVDPTRGAAGGPPAARA